VGTEKKEKEKKILFFYIILMSDEWWSAVRTRCNIVAQTDFDGYATENFAGLAICE